MATRIDNSIRHVIWNNVRLAPHQAIVGELDISSKRIREVVGRGMKYKDVLNKLQELKLIEKIREAGKDARPLGTKRSTNGWRCAGYKINIWLLLWITYGDRQDQLSWTPDNLKKRHEAKH